MDDEEKASASSGANVWLWVPNISYGPFGFGSHRKQTPYVGPQREPGRPDELDPHFYDSRVGDIRLSFWNDYLIGVQASGTFVIDGVELIGAKFDQVLHLVSEEPEIASYELAHFAEFDLHHASWFIDADWRVTSVDVGIDPERVPGRSPDQPD